MTEVSPQDKLFLQLIRENVTKFLGECASELDGDGLLVLDVAPQIHAGAKAHFKKAVVKTLDINKDTEPDYVADLCKRNQEIPDNFFDILICTEVLEHTLQPFDAVMELHRILKPKGKACITTPFNFRIHGPLPDCWRFTEHGLRALFSSFQIIKLDKVDTPERSLMPIHYTMIVQKSS